MNWRWPATDSEPATAVDTVEMRIEPGGVFDGRPPQRVYGAFGRTRDTRRQRVVFSACSAMLVPARESCAAAIAGIATTASTSIRDDIRCQTPSVRGQEW